VDEQLCFRTPEEQCHNISDDTVDGATETIVEDKEEENYDAICTSIAGLEDDEPDEGVEDSGVFNKESAVNRAAVQNGDALEDDSDEEDAEEESKPVAANGNAADDLDSNDYGEESKPAAVEGHLRLQMKTKKNAIFASKTTQPRINFTTIS
jgi:hypothetical protein